MLRHLKKFSLPEVEEKVLDFWKTNAIFEKSVEKNRGKKKFIFYEGPPTANGKPGIHHVLARAFKDIILRYKNMRGFYVPRKGGWDTHGLPVEIEVEKELGLKTKKEIEKYGVSAFNKKCKESVWRYKDEWEKLTERMGFWLDLKNPYITYENPYIETIWRILSEIWKRKLLYRGHKIVPWCPRCGTVLSSHEIALGYKEVEENSVYLKFKLKKGQCIRKKFVSDNSTYILSWTTTPWTLPGNAALAVGENIDYVIVSAKEGKVSKTYILAESRLSILKSEYSVSGKIKGRDLIGLGYEPLFTIPFFKVKDAKNAYKIYGADFVTIEDGTGVVHTAVMYGEDDYKLGKKVGLPERHTVNEQGKFVSGVPGLTGLYVKDKKTEEKIINHLSSKGFLLEVLKYTHEYPFCWRCDSPLIYYARDSWFIEMSKLRKGLISENKKINWIPSHIQQGRFGEWLREVRDWAISRERYWGTPLPIWECGKCDSAKVVGSVADLEGALGKSTNRFIFMRHGEAENNTKHLMNCYPEPVKLPLTPKGKAQVEMAAALLKKEEIDLIFASDIMRTEQTAGIVGKILNVKDIKFDPRLREFNMGDFNSKTYAEYKGYFGSRAEKFIKKTPNGENFTELRARIFDFIKETDKKYKNKTILIITHDAPVWMLHGIAMGWSTKDMLAEKDKRGEDYIENAGFECETLKNVPRDETGAFDLHKPYIDDFVFKCEKCGRDMKRVPEVLDVWFDSGAMPFAANETFAAKIRNPKSVTAVAGSRQGGKIRKAIDYPADFICEAMDQTRGWFYTLLVIGVLLKRGAPFKNVISLGLILDKNGQKMSKSKGNIVDPWDMIRKYGIDAVRWYFYTVNPPGEPKRFDEAELSKVSRQMFLFLYNSFVFFDLYKHKNARGKSFREVPEVNFTLDKWILGRLEETKHIVTASLDSYDVGGGKAIEDFINDLSRWHIRRSRRRFQHPSSERDHIAASKVLGSVLLETSKLIAPFAPFFAEALYQSLGARGTKSVHLENWPYRDKKLVDKKLIAEMAEIRKIASVVLSKRAEAGIKVRQPLAMLKIRNPRLHKSFRRRQDFGGQVGGQAKSSARGGSTFGGEIRKNKELLDILKDEINVKEVKFDAKIKTDFELDTKITHELKEEGWLREFTRIVQDLRQDAGLQQKDLIELFVELSDELLFVVKKFEADFKKDISAKEIEYTRTKKFLVELETKLDEWQIWVALKKI